MEEVPVAKPKRKVNRAQLNENTLLNNEKGLKKLYEESLKFQVSENPAQNLNNLIKLYSEWHFNLAPKFEFGFFLQKCQSLGQKPAIRSFMSKLRQVHKGETTWEQIEAEEPQEEESQGLELKRKLQDDPFEVSKFPKQTDYL